MPNPYPVRTFVQRLCIYTKYRQGALAERNTFQGERCIYNALNDRIRNLLLQYDFSKTSDPYVYWSTHISSLLTNQSPLADISLIAGSESFELHKFVLAARTPYFHKKLTDQPETTSWNLSSAIPTEAFQIAMRYVYLGNLPRELVPPNSDVSEEDVVKGLDKISKQLEIEQLWEAILAGSDRRLARQRYEDEVRRALDQIGAFFRENVLGRKMVVDTDRVDQVQWKHDNSIFADVLLRADEPIDESEEGAAEGQNGHTVSDGASIPIGPASQTASDGNGQPKKRQKSVLYPAHKAILVRSEYFDKMFSGDFVESRKSNDLRVVTVDCSPPVLELILTYLYTESTDNISLDHALDLLYAADMLFLDTLKTKAAVAISTLGSGSSTVHIADAGSDKPVEMVELINIYDVIRAAWDLRVQRLEEFAARYLAHRLEDYIDEEEFRELIRESASRLRARQETDTIELLDDIRYYLSDRFRLRFEDTGLEDVMDGDGEISADAAAAIASQAEASAGANNETAVQATETNGEAAKKEAQGGEQAFQTLDGETAEDEFASDAINYQVLLGKIDTMLDHLKLDA